MNRTEITFGRLIEIIKTVNPKVVDRITIASFPDKDSYIPPAVYDVDIGYRSYTVNMSRYCGAEALIMRDVLIQELEKTGIDIEWRRV